MCQVILLGACAKQMQVRWQYVHSMFQGVFSLLSGGTDKDLNLKLDALAKYEKPHQRKKSQRYQCLPREWKQCLP